ASPSEHPSEASGGMQPASIGHFLHPHPFQGISGLGKDYPGNLERGGHGLILLFPARPFRNAALGPQERQFLDLVQPWSRLIAVLLGQSLQRSLQSKAQHQNGKAKRGLIVGKALHGTLTPLRLFLIAAPALCPHPCRPRGRPTGPAINPAAPRAIKWRNASLIGQRLCSDIRAGNGSCEKSSVDLPKRAGL